LKACTRCGGWHHTEECALQDAYSHCAERFVRHIILGGGVKPEDIEEYLHGLGYQRRTAREAAFRYLAGNAP
jgi:hypothetical protein